MIVNQQRVNEVVEDLQGTCKNLTDFITHEEENDIDFLKAIDELIFECDACGWWCEDSEKYEGNCDDEQICNECGEGSE